MSKCNLECSMNLGGECTKGWDMECWKTATRGILVPKAFGVNKVSRKINIDKNYIGIHLNRPFNLKEAADGMSFEGRLAVQIAETTDNLVLSAIEEIAKEQGITDLYVIDKRNVVAALKKQIPEKVKSEKYKYGKTYHCPVCNIFVGYEDDLSLPKYCKCCGQSLSYGDAE